jgi:hypothetical protein
MRHAIRAAGIVFVAVVALPPAAAHRVAKAWMAKFELNILLGDVKLPRRVARFTFTTLPANAAQTYRERGRKGTTTIRFDYRVPNG